VASAIWAPHLRFRFAIVQTSAEAGRRSRGRTTRPLGYAKLATARRAATASAKREADGTTPANRHAQPRAAIPLTREVVTFQRATRWSAPAETVGRVATRSEGRREPPRIRAAATPWAPVDMRTTSSAPLGRAGIRLATGAQGTSRGTREEPSPTVIRTAPVTMTWRSAETDASDTRGRVARAEISAGFAAAPHAGTAHPGAPGTGVAPTGHRAPTIASPAATTIDAATTNRLVDDVIRRIEKRARIERERSGI